jgi:hypothetical protein
MKWMFKTFALAALGLLVGNAFAWNSVGHRVIATIALENLLPSVKAEADRLLAAAPNGASTDFVTVSTWADETRTRENGPWHYIDYYFRSDGQPATHKPDEQNVVWAIAKFSQVLGDKTKPDAERAEALRFLIHFVGDIHQPLHATARETAEHPEGDRGGNSFRIETPTNLSDMPRPPHNLHSLWDLGGGLFLNESPEAIHGQAESLMHKYPRRSLPKLADPKPNDWALESFAIDKEFVYTTPENKAPDMPYIIKSQQISAERVTMAGYRLADLLNRLLK